MPDFERDIEDIFPGGQWSGAEYVINCPYCPDGDTSHGHCSINVEKRLFRCFRCGEAGRLSRILRQHGGDEGRQLKTAMARSSYRPPSDPPEPVSIDSFPRLTGEEGVMGRTALHYLLRRGVTAEEVQRYDVRWCIKGPFSGRIIFPIYENGKVVCFSARAFLDRITPKYLFPPRGATPLTTAEVIYGMDDYQAGQRPVLVEGILDCIAARRKLDRAYCPMALLSKSMSTAQEWKLQRLGAPAIILMLDADAHADAYRLAARLRGRMPTVFVAEIRSKDPDLAPAEELHQAVLHAKDSSMGRGL